MRQCIKCNASINTDKNFCPQCGTPLPKKEVVDADAPTNSIGRPTIKMNRMENSGQAASTTPVAPPTVVIKPNKMGFFFRATLLFIVTSLFGASLGYGLLFLRATYTQADIAIASTPTPSPKPIPITNHEDNNGQLIIEKEENPTPKPTPEESPKPQLKPTIAPSPKPSIAPTKVPLPAINEPIPEEDSSSEEDDRGLFDKGALIVKFNVRGRAVVRMRGDEIQVIPDNGSLVGDIERKVVKPLPADNCKVFVKVRSDDTASARLIEPPTARNNYTATIGVESYDPNPRRSSYIAFALRWVQGPGKRW